METRSRKPVLLPIYVGTTVFACLGTLASRLFAIAPGPIQPIVGILMIGLGVAVIVRDMRDPLTLIGIVTLASAAELLGLFTGFPFGRYEYTNQWFPTVPLPQHHQFPLLLPFAWLMIVGGCLGFASRFCTGWRAALLTGALAAAIDIGMERAMTDVFGYWRWITPGPFGGSPLENVLGWFAVATLASGWAIARKTPASHDDGPKVVTWFCLFVAFCGLLHGLNPAWLWLIAIGLVVAFVRRRNF